MRRIIALGIALAAAALVQPAAGVATDRGPLGDFPSLTLWAWERPEDLRELPDDVAVAFLAQTITVHGSALHTDPRRQPLRVRTATRLIAVTRIEIPPGATPFAQPAIGAIAESIARTMRLPRVGGVQIDFDATLSQRDMYRELIHRVRGLIGAAVPLSITALASWCLDDAWLGGLPIDEAVPMLFRMGPDWPLPRRAAAAAGLHADACRGALGLSLDEPLDVRSRGRRVYVFNPRSWTSTSIAAAQQVSP
jgi:hypothetical protein